MLDKIKEALSKAITFIKGAVPMIKEAIEKVEELSGQMAGKDKKEFVVSLIVEAYEKHIDIPVIPNEWEVIIVRYLAGYLIDKIVAEYNASGKFVHTA